MLLEPICVIAAADWGGYQPWVNDIRRCASDMSDVVMPSAAPRLTAILCE